MPPGGDTERSTGVTMGKKTKIGLGVLAAVVLIATVASLTWIASPRMGSELRDFVAKVRGDEAESIAEKCGNGTFKLVDDNRSISFSVKESSSPAQFQFLGCLLDETGAPASVKFRMGNTRQMDGTQEANWDGWTIFWSFDGKDEEMSVLLSKV